MQPQTQENRDQIILQKKGTRWNYFLYIYSKVNYNLLLVFVSVFLTSKKKEFSALIQLTILNMDEIIPTQVKG